MAETKAEQGVVWRAGDEVWRRQGLFWQLKKISRITDRGLFVDGRLVPADRLRPAGAFDLPGSIRGLALEAEVYDYRVYRAYESERLSDLGRRGEVRGLYVEFLGCQGLAASYFPGHSPERAEVLELLWKHASGTLSAPESTGC